MLRKSLIILSFSLAGCATESKQVYWERLPLAQLNEVCDKWNHYKTGVYGCAIQRQPNDNRCYVYTLDSLVPAGPKEQFVLGHEVMHCFRGSFHQ